MDRFRGPPTHRYSRIWWIALSVSNPITFAHHCLPKANTDTFSLHPFFFVFPFQMIKMQTIQKEESETERLEEEEKNPTKQIGQTGIGGIGKQGGKMKSDRRCELRLGLVGDKRVKKKREKDKRRRSSRRSKSDARMKGSHHDRHWSNHSLHTTHNVYIYIYTVYIIFIKVEWRVARKDKMMLIV